MKNVFDLQKLGHNGAAILFTKEKPSFIMNCYARYGHNQMILIMIIAIPPIIDLT